MKKREQRNFRPWPEVQERLLRLDELGLNVSEVINEVLDKHLQSHVESKARRIREAVHAPGR